MEVHNNNLVLEIENPDRIDEILTAFNNDFSVLAQHLKIYKGSIKIKKP